MKQRAKMAMFLVSAAVFAGAWLVAETALRTDGTETPVLAETEESISLAVGRREDILALSWTREGETVSLRRRADGRWENADDPACPIDPAAAEALARAAGATAASLAVSDTSDLASYGLAPPSVTVMAATAAEASTYEVGNMAITGEYYVRRDGTVYLENGSLAAFRATLADLLEREELPEDVAAVTGLSVRSEAGSYALAYRRDLEGTPGWYRTDGGTPVLLDAGRAEPFVRTLLETELGPCVSWRKEDAPLYGLDAPQLTATLRYTDAAGEAEALTLRYGRYEGEDVYVSVAGSDQVYLTSAAVPDALLYPDWDRLTPGTVLTLDLAAVASVSVELGGESCELLRLEEETERAAADGPVTAFDVIWSVNGWVLPSDETEAWLTALASLPAEPAVGGGEGRQSLLRVTLTWKDTESIPAELELRSYDSAHCLCVLGGDRYLLVPRAAAEAVVAAGETLLDHGLQQ